MFTIGTKRKGLLSIKYQPLRPPIAIGPIDSNWTSTADIDKGLLHLRINPLQTGDARMYYLLNNSLPMNSTMPFILGMYTTITHLTAPCFL